MSEKPVPDMILEKFTESLKDNPLFKNILNQLILAAQKRQGKDKIKELMRKDK